MSSQPTPSRRIRPLATAILLLLAGCSGGTFGLALSQPGLDVARAALRGGSPQVALQVTNNLLSKQPNDEQALILHGDALTTLGQFDQAALDYTAVLKRDPTSANAHIGLGRLRLVTDPAAAEALFLEALQNDPRNTTALNDLGIARDLQGHHAAAQHAYAKALGIDPELHAAQVNLALSMAMTGNAKHAIRLLQPLASEPRASRKVRYDLAAVLAMGGKLTEAKRILSADLTPPQIQQALDDYQAARTGAPVPMPPDVPETAAPTAPPPRGASPPSAAQPPSATAPAATTEQAGPQVQLTAAPSKRAAQAEWQRLKEQVPELFAGREPMIIKVVKGGQTFWRLRTGGFARLADAQAFCVKIRAAGGLCLAYSGSEPSASP